MPQGGCARQFQHFISNSPWKHEPVIAEIGRDADALPIPVLNHYVLTTDVYYLSERYG